MKANDLQTQGEHRPKTVELQDNIQRHASDCVRCGLCLPHCPTYTLSHNENESPRGRIQLSDAYAKGRIPLTEKLEEHLENCTGCLACHDVCPSQVDYRSLIQQTKQLMRQEKPLTFKQRLFQGLLTCLSYSKLTRFLLWLSQRMGLNRQTFPKAQLTVSAPRATTSLDNTIGLFKGCMTDVFETAVINAGLALFDASHLPTYVLPESCCGAKERAKGIAPPTSPLPVKPGASITSFTSGCLAELVFTEPNLQVRCPYTLLAKAWESHPPRFAALNQKVLVHLPCSLRHGFHSSDALLTCLRRIPNLTVIPITDMLCCGASGSRFLEQPKQAAKFVQPLVTQVRLHQPDWVLSSNLSCRLHLMRALKSARLTTQILHPIEILYQQL